MLLNNRHKLTLFQKVIDDRRTTHLLPRSSVLESRVKLKPTKEC